MYQIQKTTTTRGNNTSRTENNTEKTTASNTKVEKIDNKENTTKSTENVKKNRLKQSKQQLKSLNKRRQVRMKQQLKVQTLLHMPKKYLGYKYVYGGDGSNGTFDCSGFTMYVYKHFGIKLPHAASKQYKCGKRYSNY